MGASGWGHPSRVEAAASPLAVSSHPLPSSSSSSLSSLPQQVQAVQVMELTCEAPELGVGGGAGAGRSPLTWGFYGAKGPFVAAAGLRQYQHGPLSLGGGGPSPVLGKGQIPTEVWRVGACRDGGETSILFSPLACPPGSYKAKQGEGPCLPCPPNSRTTSPASSICTCHSNFYRADSDSADSACTSE